MVVLSSALWLSASKQKAAAPVRFPVSSGSRTGDIYKANSLCSLPAESLNELEDQDLDTLVTDLKSESTADASSSDAAAEDATSGASKKDESAEVNLPPVSTASETPQHTVNPSQNDLHKKPQTKADKIQFALDKMTDGKVGGAKEQPSVLSPKVTREFSACSFLLPHAAHSQGSDERRQLQGPEGGRRPDGRRRVGGAAGEDAL